jgi:hypothetical protein
MIQFSAQPIAPEDGYDPSLNSVVKKGYEFFYLPCNIGEHPRLSFFAND